MPKANAPADTSQQAAERADTANKQANVTKGVDGAADQSKDKETAVNADAIAAHDAAPVALVFSDGSVASSRGPGGRCKAMAARYWKYLALLAGRSGKQMRR